jgi:hypothetical protein
MYSKRYVIAEFVQVVNTVLGVIPPHPIRLHGVTLHYAQGQPCSCRWGESVSLNYGHQRAHCYPPGDM